jgi:hypothetical protein
VQNARAMLRLGAVWENDDSVETMDTAVESR